MPWQPAPLSDRARDALARIATSLPRALAESQWDGGRWYDPRAAADVVAAYESPGAPLPPGATVSTGLDGIVLVATPFGQAGIFVANEAHGSSYVITPGPSLTIAGTGTAADGARFARVGPAPMNVDPNGRGFFAFFDVGGVPWCAIASVTDDDGPKPVAALGPAGAMQSQDDGDGDDPTPAGVFKGPAELALSPDGAVVATVRGPSSAFVVTAYLTETIAFTVAALSKKS